jgi:hypothetical protein
MNEIPERLKLDGLDVEISDAAQKLGNLALSRTTFAQAGNNVQIPPLALNGTADVPLDNTQFTLGGSARLETAIFKGPADQDPDGILEPAAGRAWLKHTLAAGIQGSTGGQVGGLEFGLQGDLGASLLQYRSHQPDEPVAQALVADLLSYRLPFRLEDVRDLNEGEILAFTVRGKLALHAKLTWTDALSAALSTLDERLGVIGVSAIQVDLGASLGVNLTLEDDYRLIFRGLTGSTRVELRKTRGRSAGVAATLGIAAGVADPGALQGALAQYVQGRLGQSWARVEELISRIDAAQSLEALSPEHRELAETIGARLGLTDLREEWQQLKTRLDGLPNDLAQRLEQALTTRVKAEVVLEYGRVSTEQVVLACELEAEPLARHHRDLLKGNLADLLDRLSAGADGYRLIEYLKTTTITKRLSFGISIGLGRWAASGRDEVLREWERQEVIKDERERRSFTGRRTYKAVWGGRTFQYAFGLAGAMERFSTGRTAHANELDYSLSFGWSWQQPLTPAVLAEAFDLANVWKVLAQRDNDANLNEVLTSVHGPALIEVELKVSDAGVRSLLAAPDQAFEEAWIEAMAAALPRVPFPPKTFRSRVGDRVKVYGRAARFAFSGESEIAAIAGRVDYNPGEDPASLNQLQKIDRGANPAGGLPDLGLEVLWTSNTSSTAPAGRCRRAKDALDKLAEAISSQREPDQIERTFGQIEDMITRPYECRLLGRVVASLAKPAEVVKSLRVTPEDGVAILI